MKILISPAKSLDFKSEIETFSCSQPKFLKQAEVINSVLKEKSNAVVARWGNSE